MYTFQGQEAGSPEPARDLLQTNLAYLQTLGALGALGAHEGQAFRPDPEESVFLYAAHLPAHEEFGARPGDASLLLLLEAATNLGRRGQKARYTAGMQHLGSEHATVTDWPDMSAYRTDFGPKDLARFSEQRAAHVRNALAYAVAHELFDPTEAAIWVDENYASRLILGAAAAEGRGERRALRSRLEAALSDILGPDPAEGSSES